MPNAACDVLVVGAGVSGLTTAVCLAEQGLRVTIWAERPPQETTSSVAGAIWAPHLVETGDRTAGWALETLGVLRELATEPSAGVRIGSGVEAHRQSAAAPPAVLHLVDQLGGARRCEAAELLPGFARGWHYRSPLMHMPTYLGYLLARFEGAGGTVEAAVVTSLAAAARSSGAWAVVNCTGIGAHDLARDPAVVPVRGQVVVVTNPGIGEFFIGLGNGSAELVYLFPHGDTVVLGGSEALGDWSLEPYRGVAERILRDCAAIEPRLGQARVLAHRVGLRPFRPTVRLEAERLGSEGPDAERLGGDGPSARDTSPGARRLVHNYGHGGSGVTLSWGCAREAARLVTGALGGREGDR